MMNKKILPFFLVLLAISGCNDTPLLIKSEKLDQNAIVACDDKPCPQVTVDYITYTGEEEVISPINNRIEQYIIGSLYIGSPEVAPTITKVQYAIEQFISEYWRDTSEFPDVQEYEAEISVEETFRSQEFATVALSQYSYLGGAHGNGSVTFVNFDIETGELITTDQLIKDPDRLRRLAEKQLRIQYELSEDESLNSSIFWFDDDTFYFSDNIGFEKGHMIIHYDAYEIASYADGPIDIELSLEDVAPYLSYSLEQ